MPWFKVDDGFHGHPKVMELSPAAVGIWTLAGTWSASYLTDGEVKPGIVRRLGGTPELTKELVDAGLWIETDGAYQFKDWADYQPMKADVEAERATARERMRKARAKKVGVETSEEQQQDVRANTAGTPHEVRVTPAQPSPSHPALALVEPSKARRKPDMPIPEGWEPTDSHKGYASKEGINVNFEAERFANWAASKDARYKDWNAAFKNWLLKAERTITTKPTASSPWNQEFYK